MADVVAVCDAHDFSVGRAFVFAITSARSFSDAIAIACTHLDTDTSSQFSAYDFAFAAPHSCSNTKTYSGAASSAVFSSEYFSEPISYCCAHYISHATADPDSIELSNIGTVCAACSSTDYTANSSSVCAACSGTVYVAYFLAICDADSFTDCAADSFAYEYT